MSSKTAHSLLSRGLRSALHESQFSTLMKARRFLRSHSWFVLAFWARTKTCWKTHSWPLKKVMLNVSQLLVACPPYTLRHQFHPFLLKMKMCHPLKGHLPPNHDVGRVMASLHPQNAPQGTFEHKSSCTGCYTALQWRKFLVLGENVFVLVLSMSLEETLCSCPSDFLQIRSKEVSFWVEVHSNV